MTNETKNKIKIVLILSAITIMGFYINDNFILNEVNQELKIRIDLKNKEIAGLKKIKIITDKNIYWRGEEAYYLEKCKINKILNTDELLLMRSKGYQ